MFTLDQLRAFVAVADEMHFGRAARNLNMTQPPLSRQIQALERALPAQLFDRSRREIRLTAAGETFLPEARRLLSLTRVAAETVRRTSLGLSGTLRIGFTATVGHFILPSLLRLRAEHLPDVELVLHEMVTADQLTGLRDGTIDLCMIRPGISDAMLDFRDLPSEQLLVAAPRSWDLPAKPAKGKQGLPTISLSALDDRDFIMYASPSSQYFRDLVAAIFKMHRVAPRYVQHITQAHTMLSLVDAGLGAALVPKSSRSWASEANTVFLDAPEFTGFPVESTLVWLRDSTNPILRRLLELL